VDQVSDLGAGLILGTLPFDADARGADGSCKFGGLHEFARWQTDSDDSGGFQVMCAVRPLRKDQRARGVTFQCNIDGLRATR